MQGFLQNKKLKASIIDSYIKIIDEKTKINNVLIKSKSLKPKNEYIEPQEPGV